MKRLHQESLASEESDTLQAPIMAMAGCALPFQEISSPNFSLNIWFEVTCFHFSTVLYVSSVPFHHQWPENFGKSWGHPERFYSHFQIPPMREIVVYSQSQL